MSKQKDKCPECRGKGLDVMRYGVGYPTCNGTGEKKLDRPELRKRIKEIEFKVPVPMDNGEIEARYIHLEDRGIDKIIALIKPLIEGAKKQRSYDLFEEIICPMCYRLNPQHATMDNGKGCHYCQEREDWQALKEGK